MSSQRVISNRVKIMAYELMSDKWRESNLAFCRECNAQTIHGWWEDGDVQDPLLDRFDIFAQCKKCGSFMDNEVPTGATEQVTSDGNAEKTS